MLGYSKRQDWWFYRKGSEIWANHNCWVINGAPFWIGDSTAKVVKFEQITTDELSNCWYVDWWFYRKGSEIWANHNVVSKFIYTFAIGDSTAKVVKFEQITTRRNTSRMQAHWWFYRKGSEIWANHNYFLDRIFNVKLVILPQR